MAKAKGRAAQTLPAAPTARQSAEAKRREEDYRAEDDHRSLQRAEEIRGDASRMSAVQRIHDRKQREMAAMSRTLGRPGGKRSGRRRGKDPRRSSKRR